MIATLLLASAVALIPQGKSQGKSKGVPPGHAKQKGVPPGLAKKGGLPPGLAEKPYVAFDPRHPDKAWILQGDRWELKDRLEPAIRAEVKASLKLPPALPPIPLPKGLGNLHVVLF
jgi:hypothetical protein